MTPERADLALWFCMMMGLNSMMPSKVGEKFFPSGKMWGQKLAVVHFGMMRTPLPLVWASFLVTAKTLLMGGQIQQFSSSQLWQRASTPKLEGQRKLEKNLVTFLFDSSAKQSIEKGPSC